MAEQVVFITGSTRGIGWATARLFARHGASIVLNSRADGDLVSARAAEIANEYGVECIGLTADAAESSEVKRCYKTIFDRFRRLDVLVTNAGIMDDSVLGLIPESAIDRVLAVDVKGVIAHLQGAARLMARRKAGAIVNVSSIVGVRGAAGQALYAAAKAAVIGVTRSAAKELASRGIRVNAVAPGFIDTDMVAHLPAERYLERIALGRVGTAEDVAQAILFLASNRSSYITGHVLAVDGGMLI